jgi:hypothetical protein
LVRHTCRAEGLLTWPRNNPSLAAWLARPPCRVGLHKVMRGTGSMHPAALPAPRPPGPPTPHPHPTPPHTHPSPTHHQPAHLADLLHRGVQPLLGHADCGGVEVRLGVAVGAQRVHAADGGALRGKGANRGGGGGGAGR